MKLLHHLLVSLAVLAWSTAIIIAIYNVTLLSANYWLNKADEAQIYTKIQTVVDKQAGASQYTAADWRRELGRFAPAMEDYIRKGGPPPEALFSGSTPGVTTTDALPTASQPSLATVWLQRILNSQIPLSLAGVALTAAVFVTAHHRRRFLAVAKVCWWTAASLGIGWLALKVLPGLGASHLSVGPETAPFIPIMRIWLEAITAGVNAITLKVIIGLGVLGGVIAVIQIIADHHGHSDESSTPTNLPIFRRSE